MKIAIVTGANRGLGKGFAEVLAAHGYKVYAGMREPGSYSGSSDTIVPVYLDVTDDDSIKKLVQTIAKAKESIALLVNNAGLNKDTVGGDKNTVCKLDALDRRALNKMFDVNATSPLIIAKHIVPLMHGGGLIVNISSNRASFHDEDNKSLPNYGYRASKTALNMFTQALSEELPAGVYTVAVHPGGVLTAMNPSGPATPAEAAQSIYEHIIQSWKPTMNGTFRRKDGSLYPY